MSSPTPCLSSGEVSQFRLQSANHDQTVLKGVLDAWPKAAEYIQFSEANDNAVPAMHRVSPNSDVQVRVNNGHRQLLRTAVIQYYVTLLYAMTTRAVPRYDFITSPFEHVSVADAIACLSKCCSGYKVTAIAARMDQTATLPRGMVALASFAPHFKNQEDRDRLLRLADAFEVQGLHPPEALAIPRSPAPASVNTDPERSAAPPVVRQPDVRPVLQRTSAIIRPEAQQRVAVLEPVLEPVSAPQPQPQAAAVPPAPVRVPAIEPGLVRGEVRDVVPISEVLAQAQAQAAIVPQVSAQVSAAASHPAEVRNAAPQQPVRAPAIAPPVLPLAPAKQQRLLRGPAPPAQQPAAPVHVQTIVPVPRLPPPIAAKAAAPPPLRALAEVPRQPEGIPKIAPLKEARKLQQVLEETHVGRPTPAIVPQKSSLRICNNIKRFCNKPITVTCKGKQGGTFGCFYDAENTRTLLDQLKDSQYNIKVYQGDTNKDVTATFFDDTKQMVEANQLSMKIMRGGLENVEAYQDEVRGEQFARRAFLYDFQDHMAYATVKGLTTGKNKSCFKLNILNGLTVHLNNAIVSDLYVILQTPCQTTLTDMVKTRLFENDTHLPKLKSALDNFIRVFHGSGYAHSDLKPDNVVWCGDRFKVIDFGLSCLTAEFGKNGIGGTPGFILPDALRKTANRNLKGDARIRIAIANDEYAINQIYKWIGDQLNPKPLNVRQPNPGPIWRPGPIRRPGR